ncbi:DivIVA domain-containing protein [Tersicoccus sp. Bi-70]|uniref:DivIVA domain-containing protein n=1 Tax=Tersicoccus sp. Bi-70 TaxID=1897634 RepID=UPI0009F99EAC|nr:DivIVA domain-containing protein [Tersicoccus sp. Bi-70]
MGRVSLLLVVLALLALGAVALVAVGRVPGAAARRGATLLGLDDPDGETLATPVATAPPVLLDTTVPGERLAEQVDGVRFALGLRGYRMEQVDEVLDVLRDALVVRDQRIADLERALSANGRDRGRA